MVRILVALVLLAHGIGHSMGLLQAFKVAVVNPQWNGGSWVLTGVLGSAATTAIGVVLWAAAIVGFGALAAVVAGWLPSGWFVPLGVASAVVSLGGIALFPLAFPTASTVGAIAVDIAVLWAVFGRWEPSQLTA